jgi:hypothetical protein
MALGVIILKSLNWFYVGTSMPMQKICSAIWETILVVCVGYIFNASRFSDSTVEHLSCHRISAFFACARNLHAIQINNCSKFSFLKEKVYILHLPISVLLINTISQLERSDQGYLSDKISTLCYLQKYCSLLYTSHFKFLFKVDSTWILGDCY